MRAGFGKRGKLPAKQLSIVGRGMYEGGLLPCTQSQFAVRYAVTGPEADVATASHPLISTGSRRNKPA